MEYAYHTWTAAPTPSHSCLVPVLLDLLPPGQLKMLDLGCGNGAVTNLLAEKGHTVTGVDASESGIEIAKRSGKAKFVVGSVYDAMNFGQVDCVVSLEVLEHLYRPMALFEQAFACLRPGGVFIITTPYHGYLKNLALSLLDGWDRHHDVASDGGHIKFFSRVTLETMARAAGFQITEFRGAGRLPYFWKSMVVSLRKP